MYKRGQVTIFLVIGIMMLLIVAALLYINSRVTTEELSVNQNLPETLGLRPQIRLFVESCLQDIATPGAYLLGVQGGVIYPDDPKTILLTENALINYGYLNGQELFDRSAMEQQLARFVDESIDTCLNDFDVFVDRGIIVEKSGNPNTDVNIRTNEIVVNLDYDLEASSVNESGSTTISSFSKVIPLKLGLVLNEAERIVKQHDSDAEQINLDSLAEFSSFVSIFPFSADTYIYSLRSDNTYGQPISSRNFQNNGNSLLDNSFLSGATIYTTAEDRPFVFMFAAQQQQQNTAPELNFIADITATINQPLIYRITATDKENDFLSFSSDSEQFPISETGLMNLVPTLVGEYQIEITVTDTSGSKDQQQFTITVEEEETEV